MRKLLSSTEAAELLNVSIKTIYAWVHYKKIPFVKMGGKLVFIEDQLIDFISRNNFMPEV